MSGEKIDFFAPNANDERVFGATRRLLTDRRRRMVVFEDEHFADAFAPFSVHESTVERVRRTVQAAAKWLSHHIAKVPIVLLSSSDASVSTPAPLAAAGSAVPAEARLQPLTQMTISAYIR